MTTPNVKSSPPDAPNPPYLPDILTEVEHCSSVSINPQGHEFAVTLYDFDSSVMAEYKLNADGAKTLSDILSKKMTLSTITAVSRYGATMGLMFFNRQEVQS